MKKILEELKERKIWRTLIAYPSVSFLHDLTGPGYGNVHRHVGQNLQC